MKTIIIFSTACQFVLMMNLFAQNSFEKTIPNLGTVSSEDIVWESKHIELGEIPLNQPASIAFKFTNTSSEDVVVKNVRTSCGCTTVKYKVQPIGPGEASLIKVEYNTSKPGSFRKSVFVETTSNNNPTVLVLSGTVV